MEKRSDSLFKKGKKSQKEWKSESLFEKVEVIIQASLKGKDGRVRTTCKQIEEMENSTLRAQF